MPNHAPDFITDAAPKRDFQAANPAPFGKTEGNLDSVRRLGVIEARVAETKERLRDHLARHEGHWVEREAIKLWADQAIAKLSYPPPRGVAPVAFAEQCFQQAKRNVRERATRRMTKLNTVKARMQNAVIRTAPQQQVVPRPALKPDFRKALRRTGP